MHGENVPLAAHDPGREWRNLRKSVFRGVKMYGTGLQELETLLADVLEELVEVIEKKGNQAFVMEEDLFKAVAATLWLMVNIIWIARYVDGSKKVDVMYICIQSICAYILYILDLVHMWQAKSVSL